MRLHFVFEPASPARLRVLGLLAESLGFDAVWVPNILSARDPFVAFAPLAGATRSLRMGPVAISPFELHPVKIANALFTLNELAGGRASIVIGGGGGTLIGMGLKPDRRATHPHMLQGVGECVDFLRRATSGDAVDYSGERFQVQGYRADWTVAPAPRLYVAANGPRMLALAAGVADGVMLSDIAPHALAGTLATLRAGLATAGRSPAGFAVSNLLAWHVKASREEAFAEARRKLWVRGIWERARIAPFLNEADCDRVSASLPALAAAYQRGEDPAQVLPAPLLDTLVAGLTLTGTPDDLARIIGELRLQQMAGVTEIALRLYGEPEASLRLVAEQVVPALSNAEPCGPETE